jgi:hypothetical protein
MTDAEKQELTRWLAERLEPKPEDLGGGKLWTPQIRMAEDGETSIFFEPAPLDGNFADRVADVIPFPVESTNKRSKGGHVKGDYYAIVFTPKGFYDAVGETRAVAVCLAAKAALEGEQ